MEIENIKQLLIRVNNLYNLNLEYSNNYFSAFSHSSYTHENKIERTANYERLEFLGDAVVEVTTSEYLYKKFPETSEGDLTKLRASIVCEKSLVKFALQLGLDKCILLGRGEEKSGGRTRPALLADIFESFVGAMYLETNIDVVKSFLEQTLFTEVEDYKPVIFVDYKSKLQETSTSIKLGAPEYRLLNAEGPSHYKIFTSAVYLNNIKYGEGTARTKKESEQKSAKQALEKLNHRK